MQKEKDVRRFQTLFLFLAVAAVFAGIIWYDLSSIRKSLWNQTVSEVLEVISQGSHAFELYVEKDMQILNRMVNYLAVESPEDERSVMKVVASFGDAEVGFAVIDMDHGILYAGDAGGARKLTGEELSVYESFDDKVFREPYTDICTGREMIGGYQQFFFADGTRGIVEVRRLTSDVAQEFILSFYDGAGYSYIVNTRGEVLVCASSQEDGGIPERPETVSVPDGSQAEALPDKMAQGKDGVGELILDGEKHIIAFTPVRGTEGWYLIAVVPDSVIMAHANMILRSSETLLIVLAAIVLVAILFIYAEKQSRRKIMEKDGDVQYQKELFDILVNNTNEVFLVFSTTDYEVEYVSNNIDRVLGITREEVMENIMVLDASAAGGGEGDSRAAIRTLEAGGSVSRDVERIHKKSGERRWFVETVYRTSVNHRERFVAVFSDRTNEWRSEKTLEDALEVARTANASKSVFLSNMSHDIRTPMNAIVGFSTLLQRDAHKPDKVQEYTHKIMASSQHLLGLINDVLDMSKIESGKTTLNITEISLAEIVDELRTMMHPQAKAKGQEFSIDVYDIRNEKLLGDQLRINQILINILSNAVKYTPEGGRVQMSVRQLGQHKKHYARFCFEIRDNGIGMSPEYLKTIFQPFSRETSHKTLGIQGTGLGMAITKNLVDLMGGRLKVESEQDVGTTFSLELELRIGEHDFEPDFWKKHGLHRLLIADDEEAVCSGVARAMEDTGVDVQCAANGLDAVRLAECAGEGSGFDLVLLDWKMPDISGIEAARRIRTIVPSHVPIMILTAYDTGEIEDEGSAAGVNGFLQKPFFLSNLRLALENIWSEEANGREEEETDNVLVGRHVLAVEDIELNAEILQEMLKMTGASCEWACNGKVALEKFEQSVAGHFDLILMDVQMPVMDGYEATRAIRSCRHPQARTIPIIAMTANAFFEDVKDALDAGMNQHVSKPIDMERLKAVLRDIFSEQE